MHSFRLKPSRTLFYFNVALYLLATAGLVSYYQVNFMSIMLFSLITLLLGYEIQRYIQQDRQRQETVKLRLSSGIIEWSLGNNNRLFDNYSVYTCRWGMMLVLKQAQNRQHLILVADRFQTESEYLDARYQLIRLNQVIHAR